MKTGRFVATVEGDLAITAYLTGQWPKDTSRISELEFALLKYANDEGLEVTHSLEEYGRLGTEALEHLLRKGYLKSADKKYLADQCEDLKLFSKELKKQIKDELQGVKDYDDLIYKSRSLPYLEDKSSSVWGHLYPGQGIGAESFELEGVFTRLGAQERVHSEVLTLIIDLITEKCGP